MINYSYLDVAIILIVVSLICLFILIKGLKKNNEKQINNVNQNSKPKKSLMDYNEGDTLNGTYLNAIIYSSFDLIVYLTKSNGIGFQTQSPWTATKYIEKLNYYNELSSEADFEDFNDKEKKMINTTLATSLTRALIDHNAVIDIKVYFNDSKLLIEKLTKSKQETKHGWFTVFNISEGFATIILLLIAYFLILDTSPGWKHVDSLLMICGGIIGSMISVIQRNKETKSIHFKNFINIMIFSFVSTVLGAISGFILYWISDAGIILAHTKDNISGLFILSILAGSSERYLNAMLKKQEDSTSTNS